MPIFHSSRFFIRFLLLFLGVVLPYFMVSACGGDFWSTECPDQIQYCTADSCTIQGGSRTFTDSLNGQLRQGTITQYVQTVTKYILSFVTLVGVIYVIYAGFSIMTSAGDEEKTKKARKTIIYVLIGIVIMWLAYALVSLIISAVTGTPH